MFIENYQTLEIVPIILKYTPTVQRIFMWLNGQVNPRNICTLNICGYSLNNFAIFQYPNQISIYLGSIIDSATDMAYKINRPDQIENRILSMATLTMCHEMFHSEQNLNNKYYTEDSDYRQNIELSAEYKAECFCFAHKEDLKRLFGFEYGFNIRETQEQYIQWTTRDYYVNSISGVFRSSIVQQRLNEMLDKHENLGIFVLDSRYDNMEDLPPFDNNNGVIIKYHNQFIDFDGLQRFLKKFVNGTEYYDMVMNIGHSILHKGSETLNLLTIIIKDQQYLPFAFD